MAGSMTRSGVLAARRRARVGSRRCAGRLLLLLKRGVVACRVWVHLAPTAGLIALPIPPAPSGVLGVSSFEWTTWLVTGHLPTAGFRTSPIVHSQEDPP